jgi:hypothetical protein
MYINHCLKYVLVLVITVNLLANPILTIAQQSDLTNPGLTPDSFWYFGEIIKERIFVIFTFQKTAKIKKYLDFGQERIAEIEAMKKQQKYREATVAAAEFVSIIDRAKGTINTMNQDQINEIVNEINQETSYQIYYLSSIIKQTTDQVLKPRLQEAKRKANELRQLIRE